MKLTLFTFLMVFIYIQIPAQVVFVKEETPSIYKEVLEQIPIKAMPSLAYDKLLEEEAERQEESQRPAKFGFLHRVNFSLENSGNWTILNNGDRIWQLKIFAPDALTINLNYGKYDLPKGGRLYVYNEAMTDILGPFTNKNEKSNQAFATGFTRGEYCIVEYHEPFEQRGKGALQINGVVHGYRSIKSMADKVIRDFQDAGECNYDVGCSLGEGWENQIKSVVMVLTEDNTAGCTGTLINTTENNCEPYLLTADHCFGNDNPGDFLNNIFLFNYQSPSPACPGISITPGPIDQTILGCTIVAKSEETDFCLLRLANNPIHFYDVYYSGWDRRNIPAPGAVGIHHGSGDVKKISIDEDPVISSNDDRYWHVRWDDGTTEAGASGSAVFDSNNKRILGQLCCGFAACDGSSSNEGEEDFGKIYYSWDQIGSDSSEQLKPWLDPIDSGVFVLDGNSCVNSPVAAIDLVDGSDINLCGPDNIVFKNQSIGIPNSWSWIFDGAGVFPTSSSLENPVVTVNNGGTLNATLTVSNAQGTDVISQSHMVKFNDCIEDTYCGFPNIQIPDNTPSGISHNIDIPIGSTLVDVDIEVDVSHTYVGDLIVRVEHEGASVDLLLRPNFPIFGCWEDDIQAIFDDEASEEGQLMCESSNSAINGSVVPYAALSVFNNIDPSGIWTISVIDRASEDIGVLNSWCIKTTTAAIVASSKQPESSRDNKIIAYPNPVLAGSKINFTNQDKIERVQLFNLMGQQMNLIDSRIPNHLSEGVYILELTLKSGKKELTKLLVVR